MNNESTPQPQPKKGNNMKPEFTEAELMEMAADNIYIVNFRRVYSVRYSKNAGPSARSIYHNPPGTIPLTKKGRYYTMTFDQVNALLGFELLTA